MTTQTIVPLSIKGAAFDISTKTNNPNAGLRGNYSAMRADFTVPQVMSDYTREHQARWSRLVERQLALIPGRACHEFLDAVLGNSALNMQRGIPNFVEVNVALKAATNWQLVAVPGLLPDDAFFTHLANRRFPVTVWLREESEFDYIVEPDLFHDFFGHVPMLFTPIYADHLEAYGHGALKAKRLGALDWLGRLYDRIRFDSRRRENSGLRRGAHIVAEGIDLCRREPYSEAGGV
jgi:phenylalanine-4-hydroxylase